MLWPRDLWSTCWEDNRSHWSEVWPCHSEFSAPADRSAGEEASQLIEILRREVRNEGGNQGWQKEEKSEEAEWAWLLYKHRLEKGVFRVRNQSTSWPWKGKIHLRSGKWRFQGGCWLLISQYRQGNACRASSIYDHRWISLQNARDTRLQSGENQPYRWLGDSVRNADCPVETRPS